MFCLFLWRFTGRDQRQSAADKVIVPGFIVIYYMKILLQKSRSTHESMNWILISRIRLQFKKSFPKSHSIKMMNIVIKNCHEGAALLIISKKSVNGNCRSSLNNT